jgi:two-component system, LytTR family, sensor kinase
MDYIRFLCTFILSLSVIGAVFLIFYSNQRRKIPGANYFLLLMFSTIIYNGSYIGEINSSRLPAAMIWYNIEHIVIPIQDYLWVMMGLEYVMLEKKYIRIAKYLLLYHPILYNMIFFTNQFHHLYISAYRFESNGYFSVIVSTKEILFTVMVISGTLYGCLSVLCYLKGFSKASRFCRSGYIIMIIACIFPWISVYLNATNNSYLGIDYFPITTFLSGILYLTGIFKLRMFNTIPLATEMVFRQSKEGILLIDVMDRIIDYNESFLELYPEDGKKHRRRTLSTFIDELPELKPVMEGKTKFEFSRLEYEKRYYSASVNYIMVEDGLKIGKILIISDITPYAKKQESLEHLASHAINLAEIHEVSFLQAQISPHFINNTLSVIASMITRAPEEAKELITYLSEYLSDRYYFDSKSVTVLLDEELETVDTYVKIEKARFRERLKFHLYRMEIPEVIIPRMILQPLVENAIRHGILKKTGGGNVWLKITCPKDKDNILFEITDDGVGMPKEIIDRLLQDASDNNSIGIINIHKRLLKFNTNGLTIKSKPGIGTTVSFTIPKVRN